MFLSMPHQTLSIYITILIYFLAFLPSVSLSLSCSIRWTYGHDFSIYITYVSVNKSTPLAVTGPHGQLASLSHCTTAPSKCQCIMIQTLFVFFHTGNVFLIELLTHTGRCEVNIAGRYGTPMQAATQRQHAR